MIHPKEEGIYSAFCEGREIVARCEYSPSLLFRMKGLLGKECLRTGEGILLLPCNSIHMWFMKFPIDALFLNKAGKIVALYDSILPWRISSLHWDATAVLEIEAGRRTKVGVQVGDILTFKIQSTP